MSDVYVSGAFSIVAAIVGALIQKYGIPFIYRRFGRRQYRMGRAEDIDLSKSVKTFHGELYNYKFDDVKFSLAGNHASIKAAITSIPVDNPEGVVRGTINGKGTVANGHAFIIYEGSYPERKESWKGVMVVHIPEMGSAKGYWMSHHTLEEGGPYAFGSLILTVSE